MSIELDGKLPPHSPDAERSVLGSMLRDNRVIGDVVQVVREENFYFDAHQKIYKGIVGLYDRGQPADLVTLGEQLHQQKHIEEIGGYSYLGELWEAAPTAANAEYYAKIIRDKAIVRNLIHAGTEILRDAYHQSSPADEMLQQAERKIFDIAEIGVMGQTYSLDKVLLAAYERIDARQTGEQGSYSGLPTGYVDLDEKTAGLQESELIVVAARPSVGKTAFALNLARAIAVDYGQPVFFVSLEQSRIELAERLLCCQAQVDSDKLRKGKLSSDEQKRIYAAGGLLAEAKFFIDDSPGQSMLRIAANARRLKMREKIKIVMVDYLQLIEPDNRRDSRQEQVAGISRRLKFLAKELNLPVLALAQLNRAPEDRTDHKPRLSDLRESGSIEQDADVVMLLNRPLGENKLPEEGALEIIIAKQRNGPTGDFRLAFLKQFMRFENFAMGTPFEG